MRAKSQIIFEREDIEQITLLTIEQAEKLPVDILRSDEPWWLRSPGYTRGDAAFVEGDEASEIGYSVDFDYHAVRPAFKITNSNFKVGEKVYIESVTCTAIKGELVLTDECICFHRFDTESNNWENSELKKFIESDYFWNRYIKREKE